MTIFVIKQYSEFLQSTKSDLSNTNRKSKLYTYPTKTITKYKRIKSNVVSDLLDYKNIFDLNIITISEIVYRNNKKKPDKVLCKKMDVGNNIQQLDYLNLQIFIF